MELPGTSSSSFVLFVKEYETSKFIALKAISQKKTIPILEIIKPINALVNNFASNVYMPLGI
jgi:hypothetical protein